QFTAGEIYKVLVISADGSRETVFGACAKQNEKLSVQVKIAHLGTFVVTTPKAMPFTDVSGHWAAEAIAWAYENGLMNGT
ncbi:S-layer homology domain-containing protein, partial [Bifidobacterium animalis]|uniref:S-layer homology domain-containing protein n=1 Tax=Bifidobacterium animalis TaxID=28025 RepID=UPI00318780EA